MIIDRRDNWTIHPSLDIFLKKGRLKGRKIEPLYIIQELLQLEVRNTISLIFSSQGYQFISNLQYRIGHSHRDFSLQM